MAPEPTDYGLHFRERIVRFEWLGMTAIIGSVLLIILPAAR